jgi:hypothetical protein
MTGTKSVTVDGAFVANSLSTAGGIAGQSLSVTGAGTFGSIISTGNIVSFGSIGTTGALTAGTLAVSGATTLGAGATISSGNLQVSAGNVSARIGNFTGGVTVGDIALFDKQLSLKEQAAPTTAAMTGRGDLYLDQSSKKVIYRDATASSAVLLAERASINDLSDAKTLQLGLDSSIYLGLDSGKNADEALTFNTNIGNLAIGSKTLSGGRPGSNNTVFGNNALQGLGDKYVYKSMDMNTALGRAALRNLKYGSSNTVIGAGAGDSIEEMSYSILIGYNIPGTKSYELNIGNLIKGDMTYGRKSLTVNGNLATTGTLKVAGGNPGAGKVLTSDTNGNATWQAIPSPTIADGSITSAKILDGSIATADIADSSITSAKIVGLDASKITTGVLNPAQIPTLSLNNLSNAKALDFGEKSSIYLGYKSGDQTLLGAHPLFGNPNSGNTAIGASTLSKANPGSYNTVVGQLALEGYESNQMVNGMLTRYSQKGNTAIGSRALRYLQGGVDNIAIGALAGESIKVINNSILIGIAVTATKDWDLNIGDLIKGNMLAGQKSATVNGNLAIDGRATTGYLTVIGGAGAGKVLTSDATGNAAWQAVPTPVIENGSISSTKIADGSITATKIAPDSVSMGALSDVKVDHFSNAIYIGVNSGAAHPVQWQPNGTNGARNIGLGSNSLAANNTGSDNIAIGVGALAYNTAGTSNVGVGYSALILNKRGDYNTALGYQSLPNNENGKKNVALGASTAATIRNSEYNIAIGYGADFTSDSSYQLNIGNLIKGNMAVGSKSVTIDGTLNATTITAAAIVASPGTATVSNTASLIVTKTIMRVTGDGTALTDLATVNPQIAAGTDGQILIIRAKLPSSQKIKFYDGRGLDLAGSFALLDDKDSLTLIYDQELNLWVEVARSLN